ncbi:MAG: adenylyl-sulfate kinase [Anaerolineales bacterium]|nr:adenylyl-sulfate kinase [Anaerolineales bacterium]
MNPFRATSINLRNMVGGDHDIEFFIDTPSNVCEESDIIGIDQKARSDEIKGFIGIDDPYETPDNADVVLDTVSYPAEDNASRIVGFLGQQGFIRLDKAI